MTLHRGPGRPRNDKLPKKNDRVVYALNAQAHTTVINPEIAATLFPNHYLPPVSMKSAGRFHEIITRPDFIHEVHHWDCHTSAKRWAEKTGLSRACVRRYAQMISPFYKSMAVQKATAGRSEYPQILLQAPQPPAKADTLDDDYDDPFGTGVSLGHCQHDKNEESESNPSNLFDFSSMDGRPLNPFPASSEKSVSKPLHLEGDVLLLPDLHVPCFSSQRLHKAVSVAKRLGGCSQVILLGDTLDLNQISGFPSTPSKTSIQENLVTLGKIIKVLQKEGFTVSAILGNHCNRWLRACGGQIGLDWIIQSVFDGVQISDQHEYATLNCGGRKWILAHGSGSNPLTFGQRTSSAASGASVAFGHFHRPLATVSADGDSQILAVGHMLDSDKIAYYNQKIHFQKWVGTNGAIIRSAWGGRGKILTDDCEEVQALAL